MSEINNVLKIGKETRNTITNLSKICKAFEHMLCPDYKQVAALLIKDWRTMIKN
jgi:hypothetical protein